MTCERGGLGGHRPERQGPAQIGVGGQELRQPARQFVARDRMHSDREVNGDLALSDRGMQESARQVERIAGAEHRVDQTAARLPCAATC